MTTEEALKILDTIPTISEQVDALEMAIKALENSSWVPITYREMTQEEKNEFTVEETKILNCPLPDDGEEVLITTEFRNVYMDVFHNENGDCYFEYYEIEDVRAWMPLPEPYKAETKIEQGLNFGDQDTMMPAT